MKRKIISLGISILILVAIIAHNNTLFQIPVKQISQKDTRELDNENDINLPDISSTRAAPGWMDEIRLTNSAGDSTKPDVAVWGSNIHVVWSDGRDGHLEIYYKKSLDNGLNWSSDIRLTTTSYNQLEPKIAISSNNIHVVWYDDINGVSYYMNSTDNGDTWGSITSWDWSSYPPCGPTHDVIIFPDITANGNNIYIVAFADGPCDIIFKRSTDNGDSWSNWVYVDGNPGGWYGYNSIDTYGNIIHILWELDASSADLLYHLYSYDQGDNWIYDSDNPIVVVDAANNGEWLVRFASSMDGDNFRIAYDILNVSIPYPVGTFSKYWDPDMLSWYGPVTINSNGKGYVDVDGNHVVCCIEDSNNHLQLYSNKYGQITNYPSHSSYPTIAISGNLIHVIWVDNRDGDNELYYSQRGMFADLLVSTLDISIEPKSPVLSGTSIFINATIRNYAKSTSNVEVKFYSNNPDINGDYIPDVTANIIGNTLINIGKDSSTKLTYIWTSPPVGVYDIFVWADPENVIPEYNNTNNLAPAAERVVFYNWIDQFDNRDKMISSQNIKVSNSNVILGFDENATDWEYEYNADIEPDMDSWGLIENAATDLANTSSGFLFFNTSSENAYWWYNYNWSASNSVGVTLEAKFRVEDIGPNSGLLFGIWDGTRYEGMNFYENKIQGLYDTSLVYHMNTIDDFHIYRMTAQNNDIMVYVDDDLCIDGTNKYQGSTSGNKALFGDTSDSSGYYGSSIWDYVRYNTTGPISPQYYADGMLTSVNITLPAGYKWNQLIIDKTEQPETYLNVTILDNASGNPIPGFINLSEDVIDISSINHSIYPSINLVGTFVGSALNTSSMNYWAINYVPSQLCAPPSNLNAQLSPGNLSNIELLWNASLDDGGGNNNVTGYRVYKSSTGVNGNYEFAVWIPANGSQTYYWTDFGAGDGDWNNYYYIVRANDTLDNEEQNTVKVGKFVNNLVSDWNLVSVPLIQYNNSLKCVFQTIEGNYTAVKGYHAGKSRPWLNWHKDKPKYMNDVIEIDLKSGYYVNMLNPDYLVVTGKVPTITSVQLKAGWNLVGYPSLIPRTRDNALDSIAGLYNRIEFYNTTSGREEPLGPNDLMYPGYGYWIHAISDCTWEVTM